MPDHVYEVLLQLADLKVSQLGQHLREGGLEALPCPEGLDPEGVFDDVSAWADTFEENYHPDVKVRDILCFAEYARGN